MNFSVRQQLTYCLNVHLGEMPDEIMQSIKEFTLPIKNNVCPDKPFGIGLRLSYDAAKALSESKELSVFQDFLSENNLYVFTINAFPYGQFHKKPVKENVYLPDWRYNERRDYTIMVADILATFIPKGGYGSISSVPGAYRELIKTESDIFEMVIRMMDAVIYLAQLEELLARHIHIGLEPEPDCFLESSADVINFFTNIIYQQGAAYIAYKNKISTDSARALIKRHLGICFDTCHFAVRFESLAESIQKIIAADISISKIQISSALKCINNPKAREQLKPFCEPIYLHQVKSEKDKQISSFPDLDIALQNTTPDNSEWHIHFHVPLYFAEHNELQSTSNAITSEFINKTSNIPHLEIETYTFDVLPASLRSHNIVDSITQEFMWVKSKYENN